LSYNLELWQSLPAEKQNELENSPEFIALDEKLENLSLKPKDDATTNIRGVSRLRVGDQLFSKPT
jgi:hypothetical protein